VGRMRRAEQPHQGGRTRIPMLQRALLPAARQVSPTAPKRMPNWHGRALDAWMAATVMHEVALAPSQGLFYRVHVVLTPKPRPVFRRWFWQCVPSEWAAQSRKIAMLEQGPRRQQQTSIWSACGGINGPGGKDAPGTSCAPGQTCTRSDRYFWQCRYPREAARAPPQAAIPSRPGQQQPAALWALCGGINGPGARDAATLPCSPGVSCNRLDQ
jgi:hypothetical protein